VFPNVDAQVVILHYPDDPAASDVTRAQENVRQGQLQRRETRTDVGVVVGGRMGYVNRQGDIVIEPKFVERTDMAFREGLKASAPARGQRRLHRSDGALRHSAAVRQCW